MASTSVSHWWKSWCCLQPWCRREIIPRITFNNSFYAFVDDFLFGLLSSSTPMINVARLSAFRIRGLIRTAGTVRIFQHRHHCWKVLVFKVIREVVLVLKLFTVFRSSGLKSHWLRWIEDDSLRHLLQGRNVLRPKVESEIEMIEVEAEEPDHIVDVENSLRTEILPQLSVDDQEHDVEDGEEVPPNHHGVVHLGNIISHNFQKDMLPPCSSQHFWHTSQYRKASCSEVWSVTDLNRRTKP